MDNKKHTIGLLLHYLLTAAAEDACVEALGFVVSYLSARVTNANSLR